VLTAARAAAKAAPSPKRRAVADADAILAAFAVPKHAQKLPSAPSVADGLLKHPGQLPGSPDLVDKAEWWLVPGKPQAALAWEAAHLPHRFSATGTGTVGGPGNETGWVEVFSLPDIYGVLDSRDLVVLAVADGKKTALRVDAQVTWQPARPASEKVPAAAKAVTISEDLGGNQGKKKPPKPVTITNPAKVSKLIKLIDGLPLAQPGVFGCPADFGDSLTLTFRAGRGTPALAAATVDLSGCGLVSFTIGGKAQPTLASTSGQGILKIAGLHWKIPTL
jgi:hypothetical protein